MVVLSLSITLSLLLLVVIYLDATRFTIPNWLNGLLVLLFIAWGLLMPQPIDWLMAFALFAALFVVGYLLFAFHFIGGGDVKLFAVCGLYAGWTEAGFALVIYTTLLGGALALAIQGLRFMLPALVGKCGGKTLPKIFTFGEPMPYGLAIAGAMLILIWQQKLPGF